MPFKLRRHEDGTVGMVAVCDACGKTAMATDGNVLWDPRNTEEAGSLFEFTIACKGCSEILDKKAGIHLYWQPLDVGIGYLLNNTKVDIKAMRRQMELLSLIG